MGSNNSGPARRPAVRLAAAVTIAVIVGACGKPAPTPDPTRVLHFENRTSTAVMVEIDARDFTTSLKTAVRPCGGTIDLTAGVNGFPKSDWLVAVLTDPSGEFDTALAQWTGDPEEMSGHFQAEFLWSRGDIATTDLPRWVTVTPSDVFLTPTPPAPNASPTCGPIVRPSEQPSPVASQ
jgi:hypothetical protein